MGVRIGPARRHTAVTDVATMPQPRRPRLPTSAPRKGSVAYGLTEQSADQRIDPRHGAEVRRRHVAVGYFDVEFGFDAEHQVDHIERGQSALGEVLVGPDLTIDRPLGEK